MKIFKNFVYCVFVLIMFSTCSIGADEHEPWLPIFADSFIGSDNVIATKDGYEFLLKSYNKGQYEPVMGKFVKYIIAQYSINCSDYTYKIGMIDSYDKENNFITGDYNRYSTYQPIIEDTVISAAAERLCFVHIDN